MPAPVNSPAAEWFPRPDGSGGLYFGSGRAGGFGETDIYRARREGDEWRVANVGGEVSTAADDYEFEPAPDGAFAILMSGGALYRLERSGDGWGQRQRIETGAAGFHVGPTLSPSGRTLIFARGGTPGPVGRELFRLIFGRCRDLAGLPGLGSAAVTAFVERRSGSAENNARRAARKARSRRHDRHRHSRRDRARHHRDALLRRVARLARLARL